MCALRLLRAAALGVGLWACAGAAMAANSAKVPLPELGDGVVTLRVVHAVNPRLNKVGDVDLKILLSETKRTVKEAFGIDLAFEMQPETTVAKLLELIPPKPWAIRRAAIYDFKSGVGDRDRLVAGLAKVFRKYKADLAQGMAYAGPFLTTQPKANTYEGLAAAVIDTHLERLEHWKNLKTASGDPVIDHTPANEFIAWDLIGYGDLPYDLIITNQLVASAEYSDADLSASLRGGVSTGGTSYSKAGRFRMYSFISTFPFIEPASIPVALGGVPDRDQAIRLAGRYTAHEIGHLLLLLAHPYANPACVMRSAQVLDYIAWAHALDPAKCRIGSSRAMTPGAATVNYRPEW